MRASILIKQEELYFLQNLAISFLSRALSPLSFPSPSSFSFSFPLSLQLSHPSDVILQPKEAPLIPAFAKEEERKRERE